MKSMAEQVLSQHGWLSRQPKEFQHLVFKESQLQQFKQGASIYLQGDPPGGIYGLAAGAFAISIAPGDGGPYLAHLGAVGMWIGEGPFLTGEPRRVELAAASPCVVLNLPLHAMERMAAQDSMSIRRFAQIAIANLDVALNVVSDLMIPNATRRIAAVLLRSAGTQAAPLVRVTQADLGRMANASRKLVSKALHRFGETGWVETGYNAIKIRDAQALKDFAAGAR
jgi:CRP/FNR family transcriptional regulator, cyclic AMP receptor protein